MTIRQALVAFAAAAAIAVPATTAQAGEDEEVFALGALAGAALVTVIGGITAAAAAKRAETVQPQAYGTVRVTDADSHVSYCANRYRTYDVGTNTFQPNEGPRRQCVSPFVR